MDSARRTELLTAAADSLERGEIPLMDGWLAENEVTSDECIAIANAMAVGCRVAAEGIAKPRSPAGQAVMETIARGVL